ncbi:MAG: HAD family phosphatase [Candidatus Metalachnospira sp.]|nr:HAD family phosphatase [Candidatus Metalachnospira sp.]
MNKKGVIFDLDGTLINSMKVWENADWQLAERYNFTPDKDYWDIVTSCSFLEGAEYITNRFELGKTPQEIADELYAMALFEYENNIMLKSGAKKLVKKLKKDGFSIAVATSNIEEMTHAVLRNNGIFNYFDAFAYCDRVGKNKAFPDVYVAAAEAMKLNACECYVFEDVPYALEGAKQAGAEVIGVFDEYSASKEHEMRKKADRYIMSLEEFEY